VTIEELRAAVAGALKSARDIAAKAENENRDLSGDERADVKRYFDTAKSHKDQIDAKQADSDLRKSLSDFGAEFGMTEADRKSDPVQPAGAGKSAGERFTESTAIKSWMERFPGGRIPETAKGITSPPVALGGMKDLLTGASNTSAGALVRPEYAGLIETPRPPLVMRQLVTVGGTESDSVEFVREGTRTNNAAPVAEATSAEVIDGTTVTAVAGGRKPQSGFTLVEDSTTVKTVAHWIPATKRALSDAKQIRTMIDNFLLDGLDEELEYQIVNGNGSGQNFRGIASTSGITAQAYDTDLLVTARRAKTKVRTVGRATATAFVFNPEDNEKIDLLREATGSGPNTGAFFFGGPAIVGQSTLWGLPRVESEEVPVGKGFVADWKQAVLLDREQATVQVSDSHMDFFTRNLVAFLAEFRAAFYIRRPAAFVEIDLTA
jgi:HK97 family phage major capsid protein